MRRYLSVLTVGFALAGTAACTSGAVTAHASPAPTRAEAGHDCPGGRVGGTAVYFGADKTGDLAGIRFGTGPVGIVFGHESNGDACDWMGEAKQLAASGYSTLAIDFDGYGASTKGGNAFGSDMDAAVTYLGAHGVTSVVLFGSSMGGAAAIAAAPGSSLPVDAVIALSPPIAYGGADAISAASHITAPMLLAVGTDDTNFAPDTKSIYAAATASRHRQLILEPTPEHGRLLTAFPDVSAAITHYLATYAVVPAA
jgi:alpha/beta superfamily hydrolase